MRSWEWTLNGSFTTQINQISPLWYPLKVIVVWLERAVKLKWAVIWVHVSHSSLSVYKNIHFRNLCCSRFCVWQWPALFLIDGNGNHDRLRTCHSECMSQRVVYQSINIFTWFGFIQICVDVYSVKLFIKFSRKDIGKICTICMFR